MAAECDLQSLKHLLSGPDPTLVGGQASVQVAISPGGAEVVRPRVGMGGCGRLEEEVFTTLGGTRKTLWTGRHSMWA